MRIAQVSPLFESVPPRLYGGTERVVSYLTEELVELGHDVTLFASADSQTRARWSPATRPLRGDPTWPAPSTLIDVEQVFRSARPSSTSSTSTPTTCTFRCSARRSTPGGHHPARAAGPSRPAAAVPGLLRTRRWCPSPTRSGRRCRTRNWCGTVHHGLPLGLYRPGPGAADTWRSWGASRRRSASIARSRSPDGWAAAQGRRQGRSGRPHVLRARDRAAARRTARRVHRRDRRGGEGRVPREASAVLFPIDWPEPFGLVMIEAMACGTPVLAFRRRRGPGGPPATASPGPSSTRWTRRWRRPPGSSRWTAPRCRALVRAQIHGAPHGRGLRGGVRASSIEPAVAPARPAGSAGAASHG